MMRVACLIAFLSAAVAGFAQRIPHSEKLSAKLKKIVVESGLDSAYEVGEGERERISLAVIRCGRRPRIGGVNMDNFIYPASMYKMYVAMEVLKQVSLGKYPLNTSYIIPAHNAVDKSREITIDPRPLLMPGDTVTINYLLDLMITRSDNTAANCLIDIADRKNINATMHENGWRGSEVTRKFLKRTLEDPGYDTIRGTATNARHAAAFLYKIATNQMVNPWVSLQLKALLARQLDKSKFAAGLPADVMYSHKTGWWSFYTHDAGIVEDGPLIYVVAIFTPIRAESMSGRFSSIAQKIHSLMKRNF